MAKVWAVAGGDYDLENLVPAHNRCNGRLGKYSQIADVA